MAPKFSLQSVLDLRHGKVELHEIELGKLLALRQETQTLLTALWEVQTSLNQELGHAQTGEIDLVKTNLLRLNIVQVSKQIEAVALELERQDQEIDAKRQELIKAKQAEEALQTLKRNRQEVYEAEQAQMELRVQDDIYIARAARLSARDEAFHNQQPGA